MPEEQSRLDEVLDAVDKNESDPDRNIRVQIEDSLARAIQAVKATGEEATVTIKIKAFPDQGSRVTFGARCEDKIPRPPTAKVTMFTDKAGRLLESDPQQGKLDLTGRTTRSTQEN